MPKQSQSGNPANYNATPPTLDDGAASALNVDQNGNLKTISADTSSFGTATADTQIKASAGFLHTLTVSPTGTVTAGVLSVYDSLTETGTVIFSVAIPITTFTPFTVIIDAPFAIGLYVGFDATVANVRATVSYR